MNKKILLSKASVFLSSLFREFSTNTCFVYIFSNAKLSKCVIVLFQLTGGFLCCKLSNLLLVYRREDFVFIPQVISCHSHLFSVVEDSVSILNLIYIFILVTPLFPVKNIIAKALRDFFWSLWGLRMISYSPFLQWDFVTFNIF